MSEQDDSFEMENISLPEPKVVEVQEQVEDKIEKVEPITDTFELEESEVTSKVDKRKPNAELYSPVFKERDINSNDLMIPIVALRETLKDFANLLQSYPNINMDNSEVDRDWKQNLYAGAGNCSPENSFIDTSERESAQWKQYVENEGSKLWASRPVFNNDPNQKLKGEKALIKVIGALGIGTMVQVPLWHSGIWLTLKAPSASSLMVLDRQLADEKSNLGRETNGLIFSNRSIYLNKLVLDFITDHIYDCTVKDLDLKDKEAVYRLIKMTDIPTLVWGLCCTIYPNGYHLQQPCSTGPDKCTHISKMMINLGKIHWVDTTQITQSMRKHMANRVNKITIESIETYQKERDVSEPLELTDKAKVVLHTPSVYSYIQSGYRWLEEIKQLIDNNFTSTLSENERENYLSNQMMLSTIRQYGHWIKEFHLGDDLVIEDDETMEPIISEISLNDNISEKFFKRIAKFIDDSTIALVAIPRTNCPACGTPMSEEDIKYPNLLPIDPLNVFFTLLAQRLLRIR